MLLECDQARSINSSIQNINNANVIRRRRTFWAGCDGV